MQSTVLSMSYTTLDVNLTAALWGCTSIGSVLQMKDKELPRSHSIFLVLLFAGRFSSFVDFWCLVYKQYKLENIDKVTAKTVLVSRCFGCSKTSSRCSWTAAATVEGAPTLQQEGSGQEFPFQPRIPSLQPGGKVRASEPPVRSQQCAVPGPLELESQNNWKWMGQIPNIQDSWLAPSSLPPTPLATADLAFYFTVKWKQSEKNFHCHYSQTTCISARLPCRVPSH